MRTGLEVLLDERPIDLAGVRFGLLMNQASVDRRFQLSCDLLDRHAPAGLQCLFSPQHGFWGEQQANMIESPHSTHPRLEVPVYSLYSEVRRPTPEMLAGLELLIIDLQDVGTRVYTFIWTVLNCLQACAERDLPVLVLDRPNPLGGLQREGAVLDAPFRSFVGEASVPMRHGLTLGEMSTLLNESLSVGASLQVIRLQGWSRTMLFDQTSLPWVPPSPNLPTLASARVYPGQVLLEGTNLSEGRGTTTPFEIVGAPFIDPQRLADALNDIPLPGIAFRPVRFRPTFDKWQGENCGGVYLHVTDPQTFAPYRTTLQLLNVVRRYWPQGLEWLPPPYEYETEKVPIDILSGNDQLRHWLDEGPLNDDQLDHLCSRGLVDWSQAAEAYQWS